nr:putative lrr receptor-like serine/threonine-protein kinase [Quercus suber]
MVGSSPLLFLAFCVACIFGQLFELAQAQNQTQAATDPAEVTALNTIFQKWGISANSNQWNISGKPCSGAAIDSTSFDDTNYNPFIKCDCSYNSNSTCHITQLKAYALNVVGVIPDELWTLTFLFNPYNIFLICLFTCVLHEYGLPSFSCKLGLNIDLESVLRHVNQLNFIVDMVNLGQNYLTGNLSASIGKLYCMQYLSFGINALSGTLPKELGNLTDLLSLSFSTNNFTGSLPFELGNLVKLEQLWASNTELTDKIPDFIGNWSKLITLFLGNNKLNGTVPAQKSGSLLNMEAFLLGLANKIYNYSEFAIKCGGPQITSSNGIVYERDNETLGPATYYVVDTERWAVSNVGYFSGSNNAQFTSSSLSQFTNTLDSELFQTARLSASSLRYYGLGLENGNYTVSLQFAEITFVNSNTWQSLGRRVFHIYIQGNLVLKDFDIQKEAGGASFVAVQKEYNNVQVLQNYIEIHLFWAGKGTCCVPAQGTYGPSISAISATPEFTPTVSNSPPSSNKNRTGLIVGLVVGVGVGSFLAVFIVFYIVRRRKLPTNDDEELLGIDAKTFTFSYAELKTATEDFNPDNKLGEGGFGPVYKQLSVTSHQGKNQFLTEIATISAVQHRNLVKLYGCCIEGDKRLLVYEYLENKSLDQALFGKRTLNLDWSTRFDICLGVARDFGLAKLYDDKKTHISTRVAGTIGYLALEYAMRGHLTEKADVFAFGVVALELVSGRPNSDSSLEEEKIYLLEWAWQLHENNREVDLVDSKLSEFNEEEVKRLIGVSLLCTQASPTLRPSMSRVVAMLSGDIEVSTVTSRPGYLTDWKYDDITNVTGEGATNTSYLNSSTASTSIVGDVGNSPANASKPMIGDTIKQGR